MMENLIAAEIEPVPKRVNEAALALQRLGFRILHIGPTISIEGLQSLWESTFNVSFEARKKTVLAEVEGGEMNRQGTLTQSMRILGHLPDLNADVLFVEPPEFYSKGVTGREGLGRLSC